MKLEDIRTNQDIFDHVTEHLLTQGARSVQSYMGSESCRYRGDRGLKCAAGALIADNHYSGCLESSTTAAYEVEKALRASLPNLEWVWNSTGGLIRHLQLIHDRKAPECWPQQLKEVAEGFGLKYSGPSVASQEEPQAPGASPREGASPRPAKT